LASTDRASDILNDGRVLKKMTEQASSTSAP